MWGYDYIFFIPIFFPEMSFDVRPWSFLIFILFAMLTFFLYHSDNVWNIPIDICRYASVKMHGPYPVIAYMWLFLSLFQLRFWNVQNLPAKPWGIYQVPRIPTRISPDFLISFSAGLLDNTYNIQGDASSRTKRKIQKTFSSRESS